MKKRSIEAAPGGKLGVVCDPTKTWEYRCTECKQLRFWPKEEKPTECGNCGSHMISVFRPGGAST